MMVRGVILSPWSAAGTVPAAASLATRTARLLTDKNASLLRSLRQGWMFKKEHFTTI
jgi:hypothetical protein